MSDSAVRLPTIVIAEDSRVQGKVLEHRLKALGFDAYVGLNGRLALELVKQHQPDIVVSDIEMPVMTGYELCKAMKADDKLKHIPVILLSTLTDAEDIIRGLDAGADGYLSKPYEITYLVSRIDALRSMPLLDDENESPDSEIAVKLGGRTYKVKPGRQRTLNLLVSTFESAVEKNKELQRSNEQLILAKEKLAAWNAELETLNSKLADLNQRMTRDLRAAAKMQQSLLPNEILNIPSITLAWNYTPCEELAGDFLNYAKLDENTLALYVVDVSGHGAASALLAVAIGRMLSPMLSATSLLVRPDAFSGKRNVTAPKVVVEELNRRFHMDSQGGLHFTILYGVLDLKSKVFRYACGGHPQPVLIREQEAVRFLDGEGFAIGWIEDADFDEFSVQLQSGDRLYLYSDGVPEAMNANLDQLTNERMLAQLDSTRNQPLNDEVLALQQVVNQWCIPNGPLDDISILGIQFD